MQLHYEQSMFDIQNEIAKNNKRSVKADTLQSVLFNMVDSNVSLKYSTKREYIEGSVCVYDVTMYIANTTTTGIFNASDWDEIIWM